MKFVSQKTKWDIENIPIQTVITHNNTTNSPIKDIPSLYMLLIVTTMVMVVLIKSIIMKGFIIIMVMTMLLIMCEKFISMENPY